MNIIQKENRIYFKESNIAYGNISMNDNSIKIELIRVYEKYRGRGFATKLLEKMLQYIKVHYKHAKIILSPMPIGTGGQNDSKLSLNQLIKFYKHHNFQESKEKTREEPFLMERYI